MEKCEVRRMKSRVKECRRGMQRRDGVRGVTFSHLKDQRVAAANSEAVDSTK